MNLVKDKTMKTFSIESNKFDEAFFEARSSVKRRLANVASSHSRLLYMQKTLEILALTTVPRPSNPNLMLSLFFMIIFICSNYCTSL